MTIKGQTTTEYLIIITIVTIIALLVINTLSENSNIRLSAEEREAKIALALQPIGINDYVVYTNGIEFEIQNNKIQSVSIKEIEIGGVNCTSFQLPKMIAVGEKVQVKCYRDYSQITNTFQEALSITWEDKELGGIYTQNDESVNILT